ncbi:MAG: hypothetical protein ACFB2W_00725 [Leptolyngbyaceae cyanobacterium]
MDLKPEDKNQLATREESKPVTQRRTRKRSSAKVELDAQGVTVSPVAKKTSPVEVATNRVKQEVAEIGAAYVDQWNQQLPVLAGFMDSVDNEVAASLSAAWGLDNSVDADGISYEVIEAK